MSSREKQPTVSETDPPLNHSLVKDKGSIADTPKLSGTKREQSSSPSTPQFYQPSSPNEQLVYVRRKLETDPPLRNRLIDQSSETKSPKEQETKISGVTFLQLSPASLILPSRLEPRMTRNLMHTPLTNHTCVSPAHAFEPQRQVEGHWKERFIRLQMFLKNCDQSNQEKYIQSFGSLSAADLSKQAFELEKRAIQLLLDEGRELQKMKVLNVLGKPLKSDSQSNLSSQPLSPAHNCAASRGLSSQMRLGA